MNYLAVLAQANPAVGKVPTLQYVWDQATGVGIGIIVVLVLLSMCAWGVMAFKAMQMRRARRYNAFFETEFRSQDKVMGMFERRIQAEGCPLFNVYQEGGHALEERLKGADGERRRRVSLKSMEHIKGVLEAVVSRETVKLEGGLILLAIAVSGAPFIGLLGTVWGVMEVFSQAGQTESNALKDVAPGVAAALATTVAGLLVAIPSMFGYNWLVHQLRVHTVEMDNFAQDFSSRIETEYLEERPVRPRPQPPASEDTGRASPEPEPGPGLVPAPGIS